MPFGFGLSYTSFRYALRVVGATSFVVDVTNIGSMAADDVVLCSSSPPAPPGGAEGSVAFDHAYWRERDGVRGAVGAFGVPRRRAPIRSRR